MRLSFWFGLFIFLAGWQVAGRAQAQGPARLSPEAYKSISPLVENHLFRFQTGHYGRFYNCDEEEFKRDSPLISWESSHEPQLAKRLGWRERLRHEAIQVVQRIVDGSCCGEPVSGRCESCERSVTESQAPQSIDQAKRVDGSGEPPAYHWPSGRRAKLSTHAGLIRVSPVGDSKAMQSVAILQDRLAGLALPVTEQAGDSLSPADIVVLVEADRSDGPSQADAASMSGPVVGQLEHDGLPVVVPSLLERFRWARQRATASEPIVR